MNLKATSRTTLFESDNNYRILQDLKVRRFPREQVVKLRVPKGTKMRVSRTFREVIEHAKAVVRYDGEMLHFLQEAHVLADEFSLKDNEIKNIRQILRHEKGKKTHVSKPIYSIKMRDICEQTGAKKITIPGGVSPLCFDDEIVVSLHGKNYFYITTKDVVNQAEFILLDLKSKKANTKNKKIMVY